MLLPRPWRPPASHVRPAEIRGRAAGHRPLPRVDRASTSIGRRGSQPDIEEPRPPPAAGGRPDRPLRQPDPCGTDGLAILQIMIPKGELSPSISRGSPSWPKSTPTSTSTARTGRISSCTASPRAAAELRAEIRSLGLGDGGFLRPGRRGHLRRHDLLPAGRFRHAPHRCSTCLHAWFARRSTRPSADKALVNITGCPNSCSPYQIADIGLRGLRIRERQGSARGLPVTVGGTQQRFRPAGGRVQDGRLRRASSTAVLDTFLRSRRAKRPWRIERGPAGTRALSARPCDALGIDYRRRGAESAGAFRRHRPGADGLDMKTLAPRRALPRRLPGADQCARVHSPHRPRATGRGASHQPGRQRLSRRAGADLHAALRKPLPPPVDQHPRPGDASAT